MMYRVLFDLTTRREPYLCLTSVDQLYRDFSVFLVLEFFKSLYNSTYVKHVLMCWIYTLFV